MRCSHSIVRNEMHNIKCTCTDYDGPCDLRCAEKAAISSIAGVTVKDNYFSSTVYTVLLYVVFSENAVCNLQLNI